MAETGRVHVTEQRIKPSLASRPFHLRRLAVHTYPCFDKWARQPRPHRPLMIGAIPFGDTTVVDANISRLTGR
jgi:hypothetical protein